MPTKTEPQVAEATGYSDDYSFDEAFRDAVGKLPPPPTNFPDQIHRTQVMAIGSEVGGIAGFNRMYVRLRRLADPFSAFDPASLGGEVSFPFGLPGGGQPYPLPGPVPDPLPAKLLYAVDKVKVDVLESRPPKYAIGASGLASSSGWSFARLRPLPAEKPPADGIYDFELVAIPPSGIVLWVLTPISTLFPLVWQPDGGGEVRGIRVIAGSNEEVVLLAGVSVESTSVKVGPFDAGPPA